MKKITSYSLFLICLLFFVVYPAKAADDSILNRTIQLPKSEATVYRLLGQVSELTGYLFIYDSELVNNEKVVKLKKGSRTVKQAIYEIIDNELLRLKVIDNHILIYLPNSKKPAVVRHETNKEEPSYLTVKGVLLDENTKEPIRYATVSVDATSIGSITNKSGEFRLHLSDSLRLSLINFSHLGYESKAIDILQLIKSDTTLLLSPKIIPLQEVIIRIVNPIRLLDEMVNSRENNYARRPVYLTSFYREGVEHKNKFMSMTEAVFKIYKTSFANYDINDQVKLLKMRHISNQSVKDTLMAKMKSGIRASLSLDIIKDLPEFLSLESKEDVYVYVSSDIIAIDGRLANVIYFEQRKTVKDPLFRGELYVDSENNALLQARLELNPKYISKATNTFVERKSRRLKITPQKVAYTISYKPWNGVYYINHVRGDLYFKVKRRKLSFNASVLHTWFEMVTCKIDTKQVSRFTRNEKLSTHTIFSDTHFRYDADFWKGFNIIPPEEELSKSILKISSKVEETINGN